MHTINFLLTSLARYVQRNIGPRSFCTNLAIRARSVQKKPRSDYWFNSLILFINQLMIYCLFVVLLIFVNKYDID